MSKAWKIIISALVVVLLLGIAAVLSRQWIRDSINAYRAERLYKQAGEYFASENWEQAARKGIAAHYLDTENSDTELLVARALLKRRVLSAVDWWKEVIDRPDLPVDELQQLTEILLNSNRLEEGLLFLNRLVELDGMNPETHLLWLKALDMERRFSSAMNLAGNLIELGSEDWSIHEKYISMQSSLSGEEGEARAVEHLVKLVEEDSALSVLAARELCSRSSAPVDKRLLAARYLEHKGEDELDKLFALGVQVREGAAQPESFEPHLKSLLEDPPEGSLQALASWAVWMNRIGWYLKNVPWETYRENGGNPDYYLRLMFNAEAYQQLVTLTETMSSDEASEDRAVYLYYRAAAREQLGDPEQAGEILDLAVQVVDPDNSWTFERLLLNDSRWNLLVSLYKNLVRQDPQNSRIVQKLLWAYYYLGNQDDLAEMLANLEPEIVEGNPALQCFTLYAELILGDDPVEVHHRLESLLAAYPEVFDFRLVIGVSYLIQGREDIARSFAEGMPDLPLQAPRHLRVCAVLLGLDKDKLLSLGELQYLLPREKYLLSRFAP